MHVKEFLKYLNIVMDSDAGWWWGGDKYGKVGLGQGRERSDARLSSTLE